MAANDGYMFWAVAFLATLLGALLLFIAVGLASRRQPDALMGKARDEMSSAPVRNPEIKAPTEAVEPAPPPSVAPDVAPDVAPEVAIVNEGSELQITGAFATESDLDEAEMALREVKAMLLQGRPDRAIAHIRAVTGVDDQLASEFVEEVRQGMAG